MVLHLTKNLASKGGIFQHVEPATTFLSTWSGAFHPSTKVIHLLFELGPSRHSSLFEHGLTGNSSIGLRMIFFLSPTNQRKEEPGIPFLTNCSSGKAIFSFPARLTRSMILRTLFTLLKASCSTHIAPTQSSTFFHHSVQESTSKTRG